MIDIEQNLRQLAKDWNLSEKEVMTWWRASIRRVWSKSPPLLKFIKDNEMLVENTNPRSMKRYPKVKKYKCEIDNQLYGSNDIEIDHIKGEHPCTSYSDAESFLQSIVFVTPDDLQVLSKKNHKIKTHGERYGYSFEEAKVKKEIIALTKSNKVVDKLKELGVLSIPKTKKAQVLLLGDLMMKQLEAKE